MKIEQTGKHASLVRQLRTPLVTDNLVDIAEKIDAIGEALAYIIEKKHTKRKFKTEKQKSKKVKKYYPVRAH